MLYENIPHAGGRTYSYYMKQITNDPELELRVICFCVKGEENKAEFEKFNAKGDILFSKGSFLINSKRILLDIYGIIAGKTHLDSYYKHTQYLKVLKRLSYEGYCPDVIILEWTCCVSLAKECRKLFPEAKIMASEHDVTMLAAERKAAAATGIKKRLLDRIAKKVKEEELEALNYCDIVMPHNKKDHDLLLSCKIPEKKIHEIVPYYNDMSAISRAPQNKDILFWGAMSREENIQASIWFIDNVMPRLKGTGARFVIIGNNPPQDLKSRSCDEVEVTGFVQDPAPYFEKSLCFVAPLLTGAGIKVKVTEALSAGIPVLTNDIGIEGIPAADGTDYFHCRTPEEYALIIRKLIKNTMEENTKLCGNARRTIASSFNLPESGKNYIKKIKSL